MAKRQFFKQPVRVQLGRIDRDRMVLGVKDAAEILLREWPTAEDAARRIKAMEACLEVIRGTKPPSYARRYFVAACMEAKVLLEELGGGGRS